MIVLIIVFGGAFNPPTKAHEAIYHTLKQRFNPERIVLLPVGDVYHKADLAPCVHRVAMLQRLFEHESICDIATIECESTVFSGTYHTLKNLKERYEQEMVYVIGADHLEGLKHWLHAEELIRSTRFVVLNRHQKPLAQMIDEDTWLKRHKHQFLLVEDVDFPMAATNYRDHRAHGVVPEVIETYIKKHRLYLKEAH